MKSLSLAALAALALAATLPTSALADEPVNPVAGAIRKVYALRAPNVGTDHAPWFQNAVNAILGGRVAPYSTDADTSSSGFNILNGTEIGMWTGLIKCRNTGVYTIVVNRSGNMGPGWYLCSLWINGKNVISAQRGATTAVNVTLQAGFNEFRLISEGSSGVNNHVELTFNRSDSSKLPVTLSPGVLWHDEDVEEEEDEESDLVSATPAASAPAPRPKPHNGATLNWQDYLQDYTP